MGTPHSVRVRLGEGNVWYYRNPRSMSIDVYVRPKTEAKDKPAPISFRITAHDFIGR